MFLDNAVYMVVHKRLITPFTMNVILCTNELATYLLQYSVLLLGGKVEVALLALTELGRLLLELLLALLQPRTQLIK